MKVRHLMRAEPRTCGPNDDLATAGRIMAEVGCGFLPVLDDNDDIVGVLTDRDVCCGVSVRDVNPSSLEVREMMTRGVHTVLEDDEMTQALRAMRRGRVRRLPVVNTKGELLGILSLDDIVLAARTSPEENYGAPDYEEIGRTLQAINEQPKLAVI